MQIITDIKALNKAIDSIASRARKLDKDVQVAGLSALAHVEAHGDIGPVNRLFLALGKGHRRNALASWLLAYGKVRVNEGGDTKVMPFAFDRTKTTLLDAANEDPWFDHKPEPEVEEVFDVQAAVKSIIKRAAKKHVTDPAFLQSLVALVEGE